MCYKYHIDVREIISHNLALIKAKTKLLLPESVVVFSFVWIMCVYTYLGSLKKHKIAVRTCNAAVPEALPY